METTYDRGKPLSGTIRATQALARVYSDKISAAENRAPHEPAWSALRQNFSGQPLRRTAAAAGPQQLIRAGLGEKSKAQRAAEGAIRPRDPLAGLGERMAAVQLQGSQPGAAATPEPWKRELWPQDIKDPPQDCGACRGPHLDTKASDPLWQPYTVENRLSNLHTLTTPFQVALESGALPVCLNGNSIKWTKTLPGGGGALTPDRMSKEQYAELLPIIFEGVREGHDAYRFLAVEAAKALLQAGKGKLGGLAMALVPPIRTALNTFEPGLVATMLDLLQRLLESDPAIGPALVPHYKKLTPVMNLWKHRRLAVQLPLAGCVGSTGGFAGRKMAPEQANGRQCYVCGCPVDQAQKAAADMKQAIEARRQNAVLRSNPLPKQHKPPLGGGRLGKKVFISDLINDTLDAMVKFGGPAGLRAVKQAVPAYQNVA